MLLSTKDQGLGRKRRSYSHSHVYSMNKAARSSKLSLLSAITTQSTGSNGSSSTVTQESFNKSKSETSKKRKSSKRKKETPRSKTPPMEAVEEAVSESEEQQEDVDVFTFLVDDAGIQPSEATTVKEPTEAVTDENHVSGHGLHSNSGFSMEEGSILLEQTTIKPRVSTLPQHPPSEHNESSQIRFDWTWPDVPKPMHSTMIPADPPSPWDIEYPIHYAGNNGRTHSPLPACFTPDTPLSRHPSFSAWEKLVYEIKTLPPNQDSLSSPLKAFTTSSQHVLLELQSEVSALDIELKRLETFVEQSSQESASTSPSDRRGSWQWNSTTQYQHSLDLYPLQVDLSARLHAKLEQYYQFLLLAHKVETLKSTFPPSSKDISDFRSRLKETKSLPTSLKESLLELSSDESDLIAINQHTTNERRKQLENTGRIILGVLVVITALTLQVAEDFWVKALLGVQVLGMVGVLCLLPA